MGIDLKSIRRIIYEEDFDTMSALEEHLRELKAQRSRIDSLIGLVQRSILSMKGEDKMSDAEKFQAFKEEVVRQHEEKYGAEAREKYGDEDVDEAQKKVLNMSEEEYERFQDLGEEIRRRLEEAVRTGSSPDSEEAARIVMLHKEWLGMTWKRYTDIRKRRIRRLRICISATKGFVHIMTGQYRDVQSFWRKRSGIRSGQACDSGGWGMNRRISYCPTERMIR